MTPQLIPPETIDEIVAAYRDGEKLSTIEKRFDLTRSQVYWALTQRDEIQPVRSKRASRLTDDDDRTMARLYEVIDAQNDRIEHLEQRLREAGLDVE